MGFDPKNDPTTNPERNGKKHRYATATTCVRTLRTDREAEAAMVRIKQILSRGPDSPSFSLIVRRSLKVFDRQLQTASTGEVEGERALVRVASHVPRLDR